jgi:hypothetical protein
MSSTFRISFETITAGMERGFKAARISSTELRGDLEKTGKASLAVREQTLKVEAAQGRAASATRRYGQESLRAAQAQVRLEREQEKLNRLSEEGSRRTGLLAGGLGKVARAAGAAAAGYLSISAARGAIDVTTELGKTTLTLAKSFGFSTKTGSELAAVSRARGAEGAKLTMGMKALATQVRAATQADIAHGQAIDQLRRKNDIRLKQAEQDAAKSKDQAAATQKITRLKQAQAMAEGTLGAKTSAQIKLFEQLGISQYDLAKHGDDMEWVLNRVSDGLGRLPAGTDKAAISAKLFGRTWMTLAPLVRSGSDAMHKQLEVADHLGATLGGKTVAEIQKLLIAQRDQKIAWMGIQVQLGQALIPLVTKGASAFTRFVAEMRSGKGTGGEVAHVLGEIAHDAEDTGRWIGHAAAEVGKFTEHHPGLAKVAGEVVAIGVSLKTISFVGQITGITKLIGLFGGLRTSATEAAVAEGAAAGAGVGAAALGRVGRRARIGLGIGLAGSLAATGLGGRGGSAVSGATSGAGIGMLLGPEGALVGAGLGAAVSGITGARSIRDHLGDAEVKLVGRLADQAQRLVNAGDARGLAKLRAEIATIPAMSGPARKALSQLSTGIDRLSVAKFDRALAGLEHGPKFTTERSFLGVFEKQAAMLPEKARGAAASAMLELSRTMEREGRLPKGATARLLGDIEHRWAELAPFLRGQGIRSAADVARLMEMQDARRAAKRTIDEITLHFGDAPKVAKLTAANAKDVFAQQIEFLRQKVATSTGAMKKQAETDLKAMSDLAQTYGAKVKQNLSAGFDESAAAAGRGLGSINTQLAAEYQLLGIKPSQLKTRFGRQLAAVGMPQLTRATGGYIGQIGQAGRDEVDVRVGRGEAIVNRHQQPIINQALRDRYGINGLPDLFQRVRIPHYMASGGIAGVIAKANEIDARHYPYRWGGGHDANFTGPYDCSGAWSALLHAGGFLKAPRVSGEFMSYGAPGPGAVTLYANPTHVYGSILGRFFGTSNQNPGGGAGWFAGSPRPGFMVRHLAGAVTGIDIKRVKWNGPGGAFGPLGQRILDDGRSAAQHAADELLDGMFGGHIGGGDPQERGFARGGIVRGKVSWFGGPDDPSDSGRTALGLSTATPGIALFDRATLGDWFDVTIAGRSHPERQTDIGPAPSTGRKIDLTYSALKDFGFTEHTFPTGAIATAARIGAKRPRPHRRPKLTRGPARPSIAQQFANVDLSASVAASTPSINDDLKALGKRLKLDATMIDRDRARIAKVRRALQGPLTKAIRARLTSELLQDTQDLKGYYDDAKSTRDQVTTLQAATPGLASSAAPAADDVAQAHKDMIDALNAVGEQLRIQNDTAAAISRVATGQAMRALADVISGQIAGQGYGPRSQSAGDGTLARY